MRWFFLCFSLVLLLSGCGRATAGKTDTLAFSPVATLAPTIPMIGIETPTSSPIQVTLASMPVCDQNDLYLEANTMPAPPYGAAVIRVVLYPQKKDYACRTETFVNFRLESENGELLSIEGNNGVAFSTGYTLARDASIIYGAGAVWYWHNYCQQGRTNIILLGSAAGLQSREVVSAFPGCFDESIDSYIEPYPFSSNQNNTIDFLGTATQIP